MALVCGSFSSRSASTAEGMNTTEEALWKLEEAYFNNLYRADYEGVLAVVHPQFLGWPGHLPKPIGRQESALFMKKLVPQPTPCTIRIERAGLQISGQTALTQYTLHVSCPDAAVAPAERVSRITHTWVMQDGQWKLLGGMSFDVNAE